MTPATGLADKELGLLRSVFERYADLERVVLYGSRAKGVARANSDIDLAVYGIADDLRVESLRQELEDLPLPYRFDVQAAQAIAHAPLREHVERVGVVLWLRDEG